MGISLVLQDSANSGDYNYMISPGAPATKLLSIRATIDPANPATTPVWMQVFDQNLPPVVGDRPVISKPFDSSGYAELDFGLVGRQFTNDCFVILSSTALTFTWVASVGGGNFKALFDSQYI